jgi:hypothetical protein
MATLPTKVDIDGCTTITLYKTIANLVDELNDKSVKCMNRKPHAVSVFVVAAQHYVPSSKDRIPVDGSLSHELAKVVQTRISFIADIS